MGLGSSGSHHASSAVPMALCCLRFANLRPAPFGPSRRGDRMPFTYTLEHEDGSPAEPPTFATAMRTGAPATRFARRGRALRVVEIRPGPEPDGDPVLVVETA